MLILIIGVSTALMYSCEKNEFNPDSTNKEEVDTENKTKRTSGCTVFTDAQIAQIGANHNTYLSEVFSNFNYQDIDLEAELNQQFENISMPPSLTAAQKTTIINTIISWDDIEVDFINPTKVKQYMDDIEAVVLSDDNNNLSEITAQLAIVESNASSILTCQDLEAVKLMVSVTKNSVEFWLPTSKGGTGEGNGILIDIGVPPQYISDKTKHVIAMDGLAASGAFITWGFSAAFGPVGLAGLGFGVGMATAFSSGAAAIGMR